MCESAAHFKNLANGRVASVGLLIAVFAIGPSLESNAAVVKLPGLVFKHWPVSELPDRKIPLFIGSAVPPSMADSVRSAISNWNRKACPTPATCTIGFREVTTPDPAKYVVVVGPFAVILPLPRPDGQATKGYVRVGGISKNFVSLDVAYLERAGDLFTQCVVMHELLHVVGFEHEQQHVDRDDYVIVAAKYKSDKSFKKLPANGHFHSERYDPLSAIHQSVLEDEMQLNRKSEKLRVAMIGHRENEIGPKNQLSDGDLAALRRFYGQ